MEDTNNPFTLFPEMHSDEVQEIVGRPPGWLLQFGLSIFAGLMLIIVSASWLIKYPDIVSAGFTLTSMDAPRAVVIRNDGKLASIMVKDREIVKQGQALAFSESTANHNQVLQLANDIEKFRFYVAEGNWSHVNNLHIKAYNDLGELQTSLETFNQKLIKLRTFLNDGFYIQKRKLLLEDINDLIKLETNLNERLDLQKSDLKLAEEEFKVQETLFSKQVISSLEFKKESAKLFARKIPLKTLTAEIIQNRSLQTGKQKEILELDNDSQQSKNEFYQALLSLQSSIESWKNKYVLTSPVSGRISFSAPWQEQQYLPIGQELFTVEPLATRLQGLIKISQTNFGKVREGQRVFVKLDGYPYKEFGMIEGMLSRISVIPGKDSSYWGYVELTDSLRTRYGLTLAYRNGMKGEAEIVTSDRRFIERLITSVKTGGR